MPSNHVRPQDTVVRMLRTVPIHTKRKRASGCVDVDCVDVDCVDVDCVDVDCVDPKESSRLLGQHVAVLLAAAAPDPKYLPTDGDAKKDLDVFIEALMGGLAEKGLSLVLVDMSE